MPHTPVRLEIQSIGVVKSCFKDKFGTPRQSGLVKHSQAKIELFGQWQPEQALQGLQGFSHLWVIFGFHLNTNERYHAKVRPPRLQGESCGVFATRSPHRPNPLGLSLVKIERIEPDGVVVSGIDLVEGTPVFDIKPYLPEQEALPEAQGGWSQEAQKQRAVVEWTEELLNVVSEWEKREGLSHLRELIEETLSLDPRPLVYRGFEGEESKYRQTHAVRLYNGDIHFEFSETFRLKIVKILVSTDQTEYPKPAFPLR